MKRYIIINQQTGRQVPSFDRDYTYDVDSKEYWELAMRPRTARHAAIRTHELNKRVGDKFRYKMVCVEVPDED